MNFTSRQKVGGNFISILWMEKLNHKCLLVKVVSKKEALSALESIFHHYLWKAIIFKLTQGPQSVPNIPPCPASELEIFHILHSWRSQGYYVRKKPKKAHFPVLKASTLYTGLYNLLSYSQNTKEVTRYSENYESHCLDV